MSTYFKRIAGALPIFTSAYVLVAAILVLQVAAWRGSEKAMLLAAYLLLFLPCWLLVLFRSAYPSSSEDTAPGPVFQLPSLRLLLASSFLLILALGTHLSQGIEMGDESVYRFQADSMRNGHLTAPAPPSEILQEPALRRSFSFVHHVFRGDRWFGKYPSGFPAVLAVAENLGAGRFLNPLLTWLVVCLAAGIALEFWGMDAAKWTVVLLALSPFYVLNGAGWYSHNLSAFLVAAAVWAAALSARRSPLAMMASSVAALGFCLLVRPFTTVLVGVVVACYLCVVHWRRKSLLLAGSAVWAVASGIAATVYLGIQKQLTGSWLVSPYSMYYDSGTIPKEINLHPLSVLQNLATITGPSLADTLLSTFPLVLLAAALGLWQGLRRKIPEVWMPAALFACLVAGYSVQTQSSTSSIGERYYYEGYFGAVLTAVAMWTFNGPRLAALVGQRRLALMLAGAALVPWVVYTKTIHDARRPYREMEVAARTVSPSVDLVFLGTADPEFSGTWLNLNGYGWQAAPVIYLVDPGPEQRERVAAVLNRSNWVVLGWDQEKQRPVRLGAARR